MKGFIQEHKIYFQAVPLDRSLMYVVETVFSCFHKKDGHVSIF